MVLPFNNSFAFFTNKGGMHTALNPYSFASLQRIRSGAIPARGLGAVDVRAASVGNADRGAHQRVRDLEGAQGRSAAAVRRIGGIAPASHNLAAEFDPHGPRDGRRRSHDVD